MTKNKSALDFHRRPPWSVVAARDVKHEKKEPVPLARADGTPISMMNVQYNECRWIAGEPSADAPMCGHRTESGRMYCDHHFTRALGGQGER
jgi:hypothetical protein